MHLRGRHKRRYGRAAVWHRLQPMTTGDATARDGTLLRWQSFGAQSRSASGRKAEDEGLLPGPASLPIVFANGIGVRYPGLVMQISHLRERHRLVTWDYRGTGHSILPDPDTDLSIETHAEDLLAVVDTLGLERFVLLGWSMGVQVGLEVIRRRPDAVRGFGALFGTYGRPFHTGSLGRYGPAIMALLRGLAAVPQPSAVSTKLAAALPELALPVLEAIRFVSPEAETPVFLNNVQNVADADHRAYLKTLVHLAQHDASDVLPDVPCPTLVATGDRDWLTPPPVAREMAARIPDAECVIFEEASHFGLIEPPRALNPHIDRLLERVQSGTGAGATRGSRAGAPSRNA